MPCHACAVRHHSRTREKHCPSPLKHARAAGSDGKVRSLQRGLPSRVLRLEDLRHARSERLELLGVVHGRKVRLRFAAVQPKRSDVVLCVCVNGWDGGGVCVCKCERVSL